MKFELVNPKPEPTQERIAYSRFIEELSNINVTFIMETKEYPSGRIQRVCVKIPYEAGENPFDHDANVLEAFNVSGFSEFVIHDGTALDPGGSGYRDYWFSAPDS